MEGRSYVPHIRRIGEEELDEAGEKRYPARRWVVERTLGWLSRCRAILVRYEKKGANYLGMIKVACILLWYRRQHRLLCTLEFAGLKHLRYPLAREPQDPGGLRRRVGVLIHLSAACYSAHSGPFLGSAGSLHSKSADPSLLFAHLPAPT